MTVGTSVGRDDPKGEAFLSPHVETGAGSSGHLTRDCRHYEVVELVCSTCGYACCAELGSSAKCDAALRGEAAFVTREVWESWAMEARR